MNLEHFIQQSQARVNTQLEQLFSIDENSNNPPPLMAAMRYSLLNGGKRIRPILVYAAATLFSKPNSGHDSVACAVECIHAYSLIHDDLPAMDDDDLRRGKPTCHIAFDEATAILAGDALQTEAFDCISYCESLSAATRIHLLQILGSASGAKGMILGQALDLAAVNKPQTAAQMEQMHNHKTGALIKASILMGAIATERVSDTQLAQLEKYANAIGLAFQVQDDILDVTADTATLGKRQGADIALNKPTYVSLLGLDGAKQKAQQLHQQALAALQEFGAEADTLRELSAYIISRNK